MSAPLPIGLISQAIPKLTRHELEAVTERLIARLDELDGDCDLEDTYDREAIDEREPDSFGGLGHWDLDQRFAIANPSFPECRTYVG